MLCAFQESLNMTLDHKCQIFQNLNGAVGEKLTSMVKFFANLVIIGQIIQKFHCGISDKKRKLAIKNDPSLVLSCLNPTLWER